MIRALDRRCETAAEFVGYYEVESTGQSGEIWRSKAGGVWENFAVEWQAGHRPSYFAHKAPVRVVNVKPGMSASFWKSILCLLLILVCSWTAAQLSVALTKLLFGW